jgi:tripartite ATP-independent transporter DctM subunit
VKKLHALEDSLSVIALLCMALIPLLEVLIRQFYSAGIPASDMWVQHLVLWVAFMGAAIAARRGELLSLSTGVFLKGRLKRFAQVITGGVGSAVCIALARGSWALMMAEREGGAVLGFGVPVWLAQVIMPIGFTLIGIRLLWRASSHWKIRIIAGIFPLMTSLIGPFVDFRDTGVVVPLFCLTVCATLLGMPIFLGLGGVAVLLNWNNFDPLAVVPTETYNLTTNWVLPTIPLFTLAGFILAEGGTPKKLVEVFRALFGWMPGGVAVVGILVCAFFTSFTGGSGVTILAMGGLLYPMLIDEKYSHKFTSGLLTSAGSLGLLLPPSLAVIVFSVVSELEVRRLWVSGLVPAGLEILLVAIFVYLFSKKAGLGKVPFQFRRAFVAVRSSLWELAVPVVVLGAILGGFATLVQTAALTVFYVFALEFAIRRNLYFPRDLLRIVAEAATLIGGVLVILGVAMGLTNYLVIAEIPDQAVAWVQSFVNSPLFFLLLFNIFLLIVGCLMDVYSAIVVVVPLVLPLGIAFGVDPYHLGIIFLVNLELGYLTPPVGMNLFLASYRFKRPLPEVYRAALPFLAIRAVAVILVTYVPWLTKALPKALLGEI